jgi:methionine--tRNA ligase beta chain
MKKDNIFFPDFSKLDLRIGTVISVEAVLGSERLVKMEVDFGEEIGQRQIIAGIAQLYKTKDMINKQVVCLVNLEPKKMMGLKSQGMMLAAGDKEFCPLIPEKTLPNGTIVR